MKRRITILAALVLLTLISIGLAIYSGIRKDSAHNHSAALLFSPMHFPSGKSAPSIHDKFVSEIDTSRYSAVDTPEWTANKQIGTMENWAWEPERSDWFVVNENGTKNYVHFSSHSNHGFSVNVWTMQELMLHQDESKAIAGSEDQKLQLKLVSELSQQFLGIFPNQQ